MTIKTRINKLEEKAIPEGRVYIVYEDKDHVITHPGGYITKAEFEALTLSEQDMVIRVVYAGMDLEKI